MKDIKNTPLMQFLLRYKFYLLGLLLLVALAIYLVILAPKDVVEEPTAPPVVSKTESLSVIRVFPVGNFESLDMLQPIAVEFDRDLGSNLDGISVTINPTIRFKKYTLSSNPKVMWLEPAVLQSNEIQGWSDDVEYTITIGQGSRSLDGAILKDSYIFKFRNSPGNVYMMAD